MSDGQAPSKSDSLSHIFVELIRALAWPIIALIALAAFWRPLHDAAAVVPSLLQKTDTISVSGVKLTVRKGSIGSATPQAQAALDKLDGDDIRLILETTTGDIYYSPWDKEQEVSKKEILGRWKKLIGLGLATNIPKVELAKKANEDKQEYEYGVRTTDTFERVRETLIGITAEIVSDAKTVTQKE